MRVFVSYTTKDPVITKEKLEQVEKIVSPFADVFIDLLHNEKGKQCRVNRELRRCDVFLQLVSPDHPSEWVTKEVLTARKKGKSIIKVNVDELLAMDQEQTYLLLADVEKKGWSVWTILVIALLVCVGVSIVGIWLSYLFADSQMVGDEINQLPNARGLFGDSWGGVNAIISAFAFAGVIVTLFLQNRDLNLQRKEMARQREEFEKENETLKYQRFENLFYNMLNLQQEIVAGLRFDYQDEERYLVSSGIENTPPIQDTRRINRNVTGREVFRYSFDNAVITLSEKDSMGQNVKLYGYRQFLYHKGLMAYDSTWIPTYYDHYFRHLYKIIQFVDSQEFSFEKKYKYISLLRGTLSRYELVWIYYNALNPSFEKFKKLIEKYSLLKNIREDLLTRTMEMGRYCGGLGLTPKMIKDKGFSALDFEFYLTDNENVIGKYHISAFWKKEDQQDGYDYISRWNAFINDVAGKVVAVVD